MVFEKGTGVKLLGMDLTVDPYIVEEDDDDLFGDGGIPGRGETDGDAIVCEPEEPAGVLGSDAEFEFEEKIESRILPRPSEPTQSQEEDHRAEGHIPFRSWCSECVRARGTGEQHRGRRDRREICTFSFDYLHLDASGIPVKKASVLAGAEVSLTILVAKDSLGKAVFAHAVPQKGVDADHYAVDVLMEDIGWLGYTALSLRSDNEPAILKLLRHAVTEARIRVDDLTQVMTEHPNAYDHAGNGEVENAVKQVTGILRTNKLDLEKRIGKDIPLGHPVVTWLVEYAAWMINVRVVGSDGLVAYQRVRKRPFHKRILPMGEVVHVHLPPDGPDRAERGALDSRAVEGVMLGYGAMSHSYWVWLPHARQVKPMRSITRMPLSQRWSAEKLEDIDVPRKGMHAGRGARAVPFTDRAPDHSEAVRKARTARRLELRQSDFDPARGGHGWTEHCPKCNHARLHGWRSASTAQHSAACRARIEKELVNTARGRERLERTRVRFDRQTRARADARDGKLAEDDAGGEPQHEDPKPEPVPEAPAAEDQEMAESQGDSSYEAMEDSSTDSDDETMIEHELYSPMSVQHLSGSTVQAEDADVLPVMNLLSQEEIMSSEVLEINREIVQIIAQMGGNPRSYRRDRQRSIQNLVSEIYSAPRVTKTLKMLPTIGLIPGFALDLTGQDEAGESWDFTRAEMRAKARALVLSTRPLFVVGSPPCTPFSSWQHLNAARHGWSEQDIRRRRVEGELHMRFCCEIYAMQLSAGRYFLHEQPASAASWTVPEILELLKDPRVQMTVGHQCQYGQQTSSGQPIKKPTGWMSNSPAILEQLQKMCSGKGGACSRRGGGHHAVASGKTARAAAVYPFRLCRAILRGCQRQLQRDGKLQAGLHGLQPAEDEVMIAVAEAIADCKVEEDWQALGMGWPSKANSKVIRDSVTGQLLPEPLVRAARKLELEYFESKQVWEKVPRSEALARTGKRPISVRWIDVNKGDDDDPKLRSRLVAREIRKPGEDPIFAPTPPLESLRTILSLAATDFKDVPSKVRDPKSPDRIQVSFIDISRAYFCASTDPDEPTYVELPPEDPDHGVLVGRLLKHMYGTRKAADGWHCEYAGRLVSDLGFEVGDASACVFYHAARELRCSVHGDDLTTVGSKTNLDWFRSELEKLYELKEAHRLGPGEADDKEATVLNRVVRWTQDGLEYEADPRQGEKLLRDLKLEGEGVKAAATPGVKATREQLDADTPLEPAKQTPYRAVVARANYLASDRPELQYGAKEVCRWMSAPTELALKALKRLGRYVVSHRRLVFQYPWQTVDKIDAYSDTDWSGCPKTRKSTSGGCLMLGRHLIKSWSSTQASVSLSSGEAEFYGVVKASGICLGYQSLAKDLGYTLPVRVWTDSTATLGICGRQGLGKLRHIDTQCLWIQQRVRDRTIELVKVRGEENPADLFTKHLSSRERIHDLLDFFGCRYASGRAVLAPQLRAATGTTKGELLALATQTVSWEGHVFPAVEFEGETLPEAFPSEPGRLPHLHQDESSRYPRAAVHHQPGDLDPREDDQLEQRGTALGKAPARCRRK